MNATIRVERYNRSLRRLVPAVGSKRISFQGGPAKFIPVEITAPAKPGGYRLSMSGSHKTIDGTQAWFVVSGTARRSTRIKRFHVRHSSSRRKK